MNGIAYHTLHFAPINPPPYGFGALFIVQRRFSSFLQCRAPGLQLAFRYDLRKVMTCGAFADALAVYGLIGHAIGHGWLRAPLFGVAPCPTTIFTFGVPMLSPQPFDFWLVIIHIAWAAVGFTAATLLGVPEYLSLAVAAIALLYWQFNPETKS